MAILDKICDTKDLKTLSTTELKDLAEEMRALIIKKVNTTGGHMGPNLGFIEPTIALHKVFNSPIDKIVFDVSHQCYPHKILTGRKACYQNPEKYLEISGFTNPEESPHDTFVVGHTSTAASLAVGLAKGRDVQGENYNVIAIVGDGSLSGGEAYEGLNNAAILSSNIIIVINDNEMSIAENQGGLYENLKTLRETNGKAECNFFKTLGFDYVYVDKGNDIEALIEAFENVKDCKKPVILHLHTLKGKGLKVAEENKEMFHWILPGTLDRDCEQPFKMPECYDSITKDYILKKFEADKKLVVINPATPGAMGFGKDFRQKLGTNFIDVGIAEEHAVAYASGIARAGGKPILAVLSSFVQRTYDQLSQDLALNNSAVTILVYWGGLSGADMTHLGSFDISLISNIPNIIHLAPTSQEEYLKMLDWSVEQTEHPVVIRVPLCDLRKTGVEDKTDYSVLNKFKMISEGKDVAIIAVGNFFELGEQTTVTLAKNGINATLINPRFISGLDEELLNSLKSNHKVVATLESGILDGGFGQKVASFYGNSDMKVLNFGGEKEFPDRVPIEKLLQKYHLTPELIAQDVTKVL